MIIPGIDQTSVAGYLISWYEDRKQERLMKERIWNECWLAYDCKFGETWADLEDYRSKRYLSLPWQMVETVASSWTNGVMPSADWFNILGRTPNDDNGSKAMQGLLKWQHYKSNHRNSLKEAIKQAAIFGNVPIAVDWHEENLEIPDPEQYAAQLAANSTFQMGNGTPGLSPKASAFPTKTVRSYDGPKISVGNVFDFVQDLTPSDKTYALRGMRFFRSLGYLKNMSKEDDEGYSLYENIDSLRNETIFKESSDALQLSTERQVGIAKHPKDMVELIQFEGDIEIPDGAGGATFYHNHICVVANRTTVIRFEPNPFYHGRPIWELFTLFPEPNELYGRGVLEVILGINDGIQCRYNQTIEANGFAVNPSWKYKPDGVFDPDNFVSAPGSLTECSDPQNNLVPLIVPNESSLSWKEIDFGINQMNLITGAQMDFGNDPSATQVSIQSGMSAQRTKETLNHINGSLLTPLLNKEIALNQQLMDEPTWIRIVSDSPGMVNDPVTGLPSPMAPQAIKVSPEDIAGEFDIMAIGADQTGMNAQKSKDLFQITNTLLQSPAAKVIKLPEFVNEIYRIGGFFDAYKFIKTPEEVAADEQRELTNQAVLKQMGSANPGGAPGGQNGTQSPGPEPGPIGLPSMAGNAEGPGELPGGPNTTQMAGNRFG